MFGEGIFEEKNNLRRRKSPKADKEDGEGEEVPFEPPKLERRVTFSNLPRAGAPPEGFFDRFPLHLREGPWHPITGPFIGTLTFLLVALTLYFVVLQGGYQEFLNGIDGLPPAGTRADNFRLCLGAYVLLFITCIACAGHAWIVISYTVHSWIFLGIRLVAAGLGEQYYAAKWIGEALRYTVLTCHSVVISVWWFVILPAILAVSPPKARRAFLKFQFGPILLNLHMLDLVFAVADLKAGPSRPATSFDVFLMLGFSVYYLWFYLLVLDPNGAHLYIVFTPRCWWSPLAYLGALALKLGFVYYWHTVALGQSALLGKDAWEYFS